MRDAFGGLFSIKVMLTFLVFYIFFICVALNYAKAFRVKNRIINVIEQREIFDTTTASQITQSVAPAGYNVNLNALGSRKCKGENGYYTTYQPGYSVSECIYSNGDTSQCYYVVCTYLMFNVPILNLNFPIAIRGETRLIQRLG